MWIAPRDTVTETDRHDTTLLGSNIHQFHYRPAAVPPSNKGVLTDVHHADQAGGVDHRLSIQTLARSEGK